MNDHPLPPTLIARLKAATGPDRELDAEIGAALGWEVWSYSDYLSTFWRYRSRRVDPPQAGEVPSFTGSVDAALTLIPEGCWYLCGTGRTRPDEPIYGAQVLLPDLRPPYACDVIGEAKHPTSLPISICIAALDARQVGHG